MVLIANALLSKYWCRAFVLAIAAALWTLPALAQSGGASQLTQPQSSEGKPADSNGSQSDKERDEEEAPATILPHSDKSRFWISGQINTIFQWHLSFRARYSGDNSLKPQAENATSGLVTLYTGVQLSPKTEVIFDLESTQGHGLSEALGLAGFTNLDVVRNPDLGAKPYVARLMIRYIIPLGKEMVDAQRGPISLATKLPARRLEIRAGKFSLVDFFDLNSIGSDSHLQFLNWTVDNSGAYDYAADTRGYTWSVMVEYHDRNWALRFAEGLMPKVANGINLDLNLKRAGAENLEFELRRNFLPKRAGVLRLLSYLNHANMGNYRQAIERFRAGLDPLPDITAHPQQVRRKFGVGVNVEQEISKTLRLFGRYGWNDGRNESFAYTEVDNTLAVGGDFKGDAWKRKQDKIGAVFVTNGISGDHRLYLALGGKGFLLGDGALTYGRENIFEGYYTLHLWPGIFTSFDLQHINNPGYNRDRGPVLVPSVRLHLDF